MEKELPPAPLDLGHNRKGSGALEALSLVLTGSLLHVPLLKVFFRTFIPQDMPTQQLGLLLVSDDSSKPVNILPLVHRMDLRYLRNRMDRMYRMYRMYRMDWMDWMDRMYRMDRGWRKPYHVLSDRSHHNS
ncbi:unnamed protein product, partial [Darwinula stevensoni]